MRPYLAVIWDAFHEALASRVLWVLLVVITLFLLALMPLGFSQQAGAYLNDSDLLDREKLIAKIIEQGKSPEPTPGHHIWQHFDASQQREFESKPEDSFQRRMREITFVNALRAQLERADFYDEADWGKTRLSAEARKLKQQDIAKLSKEDLARFNRLALEAAYPELVEPAPAKQLQLKYFRWQPGIPLPLEPEQLFPAINQIVVAVLSILLGAFGVFIALLVTASMIPNAFEAGSVDLLLSKPISRSGLFLAKFVGGCTFIAINAAYFIIGIWLILGLRLGLWNERLLWVVPLYVFLFAIYYGVSALAGVIWRNAIVSVVLAVVFWLVCFLLGTANDIVEELAINPRRLVHVTPAGESLIVANQSEVFHWDEHTHDWSEIFAGRGNNEPAFVTIATMAGPVYDAKGDRILAFRKPIPGFAQFGGMNRLLIGNKAEGWRRTEGVTLPEGADGLFIGPQGGIFVTATSGLHELQGDLSVRQPDLNFFGMHIPLPTTGGKFVRLGPDLQLRRLQSSALDPISGDAVFFDGSQLVLLGRSKEGKYAEPKRVKFDTKLEGRVSIAGGEVYLALGGGEVRRFDRTLKVRDTLETNINSTPLAMAASHDGRYRAVLYRNSRLWLYDTREQETSPLRIAGQGDISAVALDEDFIYVADHLTRVTKYDLAKAESNQQWQGTQPTMEQVYRFGLHPLYTIFPKPGELNETVNYVLTSEDSKIAGPRLDESARETPAQVDLWGPIWSNLVFLAAVLLITCVYVQRRDF